MDRAQIEAEIEHLKKQHQAAIDTAKQAEGALSALQWVLDGMGVEAPILQQIQDAVDSGNVHPIAEED